MSSVNQVAFRVDGGGDTGFGHAVRCLSIARQLKEVHRIETCFYSRPYHQLEKLYQEHGVDYEFEEDLSEIEFLDQIARRSKNRLLFIDKIFPYQREPIQRIKEHLKVLMFHNQCEGMFFCDCVVFPIAHLERELIDDPRWELSPASFHYGPEYVIINHAVQKVWRKVKQKPREPYLSITTGASDPQGVLLKLLQWISCSGLKIPVRVLVGQDFLSERELAQIAADLDDHIKLKEFNYEDLLASRMTVSTFGVTTYELIYAHIPVISLGHARKNAWGSKILADRYGCLIDLGYYKEINPQLWLDTVQEVWTSPERMAAIRANQEGLIDGRGVNRLGKIISDCFHTEESLA